MTDTSAQMSGFICINWHCTEPVESAGDACPDHKCNRCGGRGSIIQAMTAYKCPDCHDSCPECGRVLNPNAPMPPTARLPGGSEYCLDHQAEAGDG